MWIVIGLLILAAAVVAAVKMGKKSSDASFIHFPCRICQTEQNVSIAETMRRVREAHGKGALGELSKHEILCMKCGASQTSDWLMNPRTKAILNELDGAVYRDQTTAEYMNIVSADIPGAPSLNAAPPLNATPNAAPPAIPDPAPGTKVSS
jgi:hypothetical protein